MILKIEDATSIRFGALSEHYVQQIHDNDGTNSKWFIYKCEDCEWEKGAYDFHILITPEYVWDFLNIFDYPAIVYPKEGVIKIYDGYIEG